METTMVKHQILQKDMKTMARKQMESMRIEQQAAQLKRIQDVRDEIAASGKDHLSDYWIETIEFKVITE